MHSSCVLKLLAKRLDLPDFSPNEPTSQARSVITTAYWCLTWLLILASLSVDCSNIQLSILRLSICTCFYTSKRGNNHSLAFLTCQHAKLWRCWIAVKANSPNYVVFVFAFVELESLSCKQNIKDSTLRQAQTTFNHSMTETARGRLMCRCLYVCIKTVANNSLHLPQPLARVIFVLSTCQQV